MQKKGISDYLNISDKIIFYDHHKCHATYGLYASGQSKNNTIVVTADGGGDGSNGTVWINKKIIFIQVYKTNLCNIGRMYRYATLSMGFKPTEHEYKIMGLAGYGLKNNVYYDYANKIYAETLNLKGINFYYKIKPKDNFLL